jgi:hypothetical protein
MTRPTSRRPTDQTVASEEPASTGGVEGEDVQGHGMPLTAPPSVMQHRSPGHGGEVTPSNPDEEDPEEHRTGRR